MYRHRSAFWPFIIAGLAAVAADLAGHWDRWFWLRYHDTSHGSHVRARFHGNRAVPGGQVLPAISAWCAEMIRQRLSGGFTLEPYDQEIERYGGPDSIGAAEQAFATDSRLVLAVLAAITDPDQRLVMAALSGRHVDRAARRRLDALRPQVRSAGQADRGRSAFLPPDHPAWLDRQAAFATYRDTLEPAQGPSCASALIHLHANRLLGGTDTEPLARALAADLLARPG
jgi:hypothetical protein